MVAALPAGQTFPLAEVSRCPRHGPHQTVSAIEGVVVRLRKQTGFGAERLKMEFEVACGVGAIKRIVRQRGLSRPRRKKHQTKKTLREIKRHGPIFGQLSADTQFLRDIPQYWPQMRRLACPSSNTPYAKWSAACASAAMPMNSPKPIPPSWPNKSATIWRSTA